MLGALTGLAVSHVIGADRKAVAHGKGEQVSGVYGFTVIFFPFVFVVAIAALVLMKAINFGISSFEQFKTSLAAVETLFGAYTGRALASLFERRRTR